MSTRTSDKPIQDCHGFIGQLRPYVQLIAGLSVRKPRFDSRVYGMNFVMAKVALRQGFFLIYSVSRCEHLSFNIYTHIPLNTIDAI